MRVGWDRNHGDKSSSFFSKCFEDQVSSRVTQLTVVQRTTHAHLLVMAWFLCALILARCHVMLSCVPFAGDAGDNFYVIDEGTFDVSIKKEGVETKVYQIFAYGGLTVLRGGR